jgi:hypothetical protein
MLRIMLCEDRRMELIPSNPIEGVRPVSYSAPTRTILTLEETKKLLDESKVSGFWADEMTYVASLLASQIRVRLGERQALRIEDMQGRIHHRCS